MLPKKAKFSVQMFALLEFYMTSFGSYLPTLRDNTSFPSPKVKLSIKREDLNYTAPET
jgi:hypothetical protein